MAFARRTVTAVSNRAVGANDVATEAEDASTDVNVVGNDSTGPANESGQSLTVTAITAGPSHGTATILTGADAGKVRYSPAPNYNGSDSFSYKVCDNGTTNRSPDSKCDTELLSVTVTEVNDPPVAAADVATTAEDASPDVFF